MIAGDIVLSITKHQVDVGNRLSSRSLDSMSATVQKDWENRELTEIVQLNILQVRLLLCVVKRGGERAERWRDLSLSL